jgi:hypothetical protein
MTHSRHNRSALPVALACLSLIIGGCDGSSKSQDHDSVHETDGGADAGGQGSDAGSTRDAGAATDAGSEPDAGDSTMDAGERDAGNVMDSGNPTTDAGRVDAGEPADAGDGDGDTDPDAGHAVGDAGQSEADAGTPESDAGQPEQDAGGGEITLDPTPGNYQGTCDGSLAVALDATHFLDGNDEDQTFAVFTRGKNGAAEQTLDISSLIGLTSSDEADLEDAVLIGTRLYGISSHGRSKKGKLERARYRFFGLDLSGSSPNLSIQAAGFSSTLLDDMLDASNWVTPDSAIITLLNSTSQLGQDKVANLAPKVDGTNIEGMTQLPNADYPGQLVIGFRNPHASSDAILVTLRNADAVLGGAKASFGEAIQLDLGGLGVRSLAWSSMHDAVLILAGPKDGGNGPFRLFRWSGKVGEAATLVQDLTAPSDSAPEAIVLFPNTHDVQITFDQGDHIIGSAVCKDNAVADKFFGDVIIHVP